MGRAYLLDELSTTWDRRRVYGPGLFTRQLIGKMGAGAVLLDKRWMTLRIGLNDRNPTVENRQGLNVSNIKYDY